MNPPFPTADSASASADDHEHDLPLEHQPTIRANLAPEAPDYHPAGRDHGRDSQPAVPTEPHTPKVSPPQAASTIRQPAVPAAAPGGTGIPAPQPVYRHSVSVPPPPPVSSGASTARERLVRRKAASAGRRKGGEWAWVIIAGTMFGVVVLISLSMFLVLRASRDRQDVLPTAEYALSNLPTPVDLRGDGKGGPGALVFTDGTRVELQPWDGESRLTILLIGLDRRPGETGLGYRTDTLMLLSINPQTNQVGLLSIPRDLYVDVPNFYGLHRINEPMVLGELREPGYGPRLLMETVQYNLAIRVHNYVVVDFQAFIGLVDALGGIEIETDYTINDPSYPSMNYGYEPFYLSAGKHTLDGATALKFARTRHGDNDFQRAERQQQVLYAIRDQVTSADALPRLLTQAPVIWDSLRSNVYTGLSLDQLVSLALYLKDVPVDQIKTGVLNYTYSVPFTTSSGAQVLLPNRERIAGLMADLFGADYSQ